MVDEILKYKRVPGQVKQVNNKQQYGNRFFQQNKNKDFLYSVVFYCDCSSIPLKNNPFWVIDVYYSGLLPIGQKHGQHILKTTVLPVFWQKIAAAVTFAAGVFT